jgi:hypothetical protein
LEFTITLWFFRGISKLLPLYMLVGNLLANVSTCYPIPSANCVRGNQYATLWQIIISYWKPFDEYMLLARIALIL